MGSKRWVFSSAFEAELVDYAKMSKKMYGLTTIDVRRLAYAVAAKLGIQNKYNDERGSWTRLVGQLHEAPTRVIDSCTDFY